MPTVNKRKTISLVLDERTLKKVDKMAEDLGYTRSAMIRQMIYKARTNDFR